VADFNSIFLEQCYMFSGNGESGDTMVMT